MGNNFILYLESEINLKIIVIFIVSKSVHISFLFNSKEITLKSFERNFEFIMNNKFYKYREES